MRFFLPILTRKFTKMRLLFFFFLIKSFLLEFGNKTLILTLEEREERPQWRDSKNIQYPERYKITTGKYTEIS